MTGITAAQQIYDKARSLFDAAGCERLPDGNYLLVLGLESTGERNLDDFDRVNLHGFEEHVAPRLEMLVDFIGNAGFSAEPTGRYGYPGRREMNLKEAAVRTGVGMRGKNSVVLHPVYGPRLRFAGVKTSAPLEALVHPAIAEQENPVCRECSICVDACPVDALKPYHIPDRHSCLSHISHMREENGRLVPCDICLHLCPAGGDERG